MGVGLALVSALCFGLSDFAAGLAARRLHSTVVVLLGQLFGVVLVTLLALFVADPGVTPAALGWGALSGIGTGLGAAFLFQAMKIGRFSLVVPLSDVAGVAIPVVIGVVLLHDRLHWWAWLGFAIAVPAIWLMTSRRGPRSGTTAGAGWALLSGAAFALQYVALARADAAAGLWPLALNRLVAVLTVAPIAVRRDRLRMERRTALLAIASGVLGTSAIAAFLFASREQALSVAVVLTSLYPAVTVLLGLTVLHERLSLRQALGLLCAAATVVLVSL
ncbi:DMT family transporter [Kribbella shirazensis]|uniref:Drug/metabolite transporter (DMT)-like permease n=1 Tax=Kribbella shirazensis TaxID=1105143 RepID=A0A7X6A340_9ACTN|nr:DMT family transporter [Kribbella shirazensis]NIK58924.1 drug/metabolite transporter (DMT)-like permease [Kribbella shirazensis]